MGKTPRLIEGDRYVVPGLVRGLQVLSVFTPERPNLSLTDIAEALDVSRSAAFRAVYTLTQLGYLRAGTDANTHCLGPAILQLGYGHLADRKLVEIALPELEQLRDETDWSTHLGQRDGNRVLYTLRVPSRMGMGSIVHLGSRLPASQTAMGRVLLADLDEPMIIALYRDPVAGSASIGRGNSLPEILDQWRTDRRQAFVSQFGKFEADIAAIAAPIRDMSGRTIAAINATCQIESAAEPSQDPNDLVVACAERISALLGYSDNTRC
ncbi:MAG: IclR family transcriptional regulator [Pseudomonadota bacterium]